MMAMTLVASFASGCVTNHDALAEAFGAGGNPGFGGASSGGQATDGAGGSILEADTPVPHDAQPAADAGPRTVTFVHGVIDSPWIAFCFAKVSDGVPAAPVGAPWPSGGLEYGQTRVAQAIPGVALGTDDLLPYVIAAASSDVTRGMDCPMLVSTATALATPPVVDAGVTDASGRDAAVRLDASSLRDASREASASRDAGAVLDAASSTPSSRPPPIVPAIPSIRAAALPVLPGVALSGAESFLIVAGGCLGGPGVTDPSELSVCGENYSPATPTLEEMVVELPRAGKAGYVGLSYLGGTPALRASDLTLQAPGGTLPVVKNVVTGALRPVPPLATSTADQIGASDVGTAIFLYADGSATPIYDEPWSTTFVAGGVSSLENGRNYTLIVVGPYPGFSRRSFWNDPLVTIVANDP